MSLFSKTGTKRPVKVEKTSVVGAPRPYCEQRFGAHLALFHYQIQQFCRFGANLAQNNVIVGAAGAATSFCERRARSARRPQKKLARRTQYTMTFFLTY